MKKGSIVIVAVVALVLIFAATSAFFFMQSKKGNESDATRQAQQPQSQPISSPISSPANETANWKMYNNQNKNYSYKFPDDWEIKDSQETQLYAIFGCPVGKEGNFVGADGTIKTGFGHCVFRAGADFKQEADKEAAHFKTVYKREITLGGHKAIKQKLVDEDSPEIPIYQIYMDAILKEEPGTLILVGFNGDGKYPDEKFDGILDQILASFKFE